MDGKIHRRAAELIDDNGPFGWTKGGEYLAFGDPERPRQATCLCHNGAVGVAMFEAEHGRLPETAGEYLAWRGSPTLGSFKHQPLLDESKKDVPINYRQLLTAEGIEPDVLETWFSNDPFGNENSMRRKPDAWEFNDSKAVTREQVVALLRKTADRLDQEARDAQE